MEFVKMNGAGNDFVIIDNRQYHLSVDELSTLAKELCRQRFSIGADGLMAVEASDRADFKMRFFNNDGSIGEMCGNGARCISRYGYEMGLSGEVQRFETTAGIVTGWRLAENRYRVRLNDPNNTTAHWQVLGRDCGYTELGNPGIPHCVVRIPGLGELKYTTLKELGRQLRFAPEFPKGANVNFYDVTGDNELVIRTYERGVEDFTLACGTGCGSTARVATLRGEIQGSAALHCPGGVLGVELREDGLFLSGPADFICTGTLGPAARK